MPTRIKWIDRGPSPLRDGAQEADVEDHLARTWHARGWVEIIGGYLFTELGKKVKPRPVDTPKAIEGTEPVKTTKAVKTSPKKK